VTIAPRWRVVVALCAVTFCVSNPLASFGVFLPAIADAFGWSRGAISVALSINLLLGGLVGVAVGTIGDRRGPRAVLTATVVLAGLGFALASMISALWHFYVVIGVLVGAGTSGIYLLTTSTIARWFDRGRGLALGIVLSGFTFGWVTGGPGAALLIERLGWRTAYLVLGTLLAVLGGLASLAVRDPAPGERGSQGAGGRREPSPPVDPGPLSPAGAGMSFREAVRDRRFWQVGIGWLLVGFVFMMLAVHVVPYGRDRGLTLEEAALALTGFGIGAAGGRLLLGAAADRFGTRRTMRACFAVQLVALGTLIAGPPSWLVTLLFLAFGVGFAGTDTVVVRAIPDIFGLRAIGTIMSVLTFGWRTGAGLGPAVAGFVYDATGSYTIPFGIGAVALAASFVLTLTATTGPRDTPGRSRT
jgi:MFS family permease